MVGHALKHFRAVDVSVVGVRITEETPYRATLSAIFPDGSRRQRRIDGVVQRIYLDNIRPEYRFFIMSTEFDKNISDWSHDCNDHKNGNDFFMSQIF